MKLQQRNYKITKKLANNEQSDGFICIADHFSPLPEYVSIQNIQWKQFLDEFLIGLLNSCRTLEGQVEKAKNLIYWL